MKISIGTNIKEGPWGGGNLFAINLKEYLESKDHEVINNLDDDDIDIILLTEPRKTSESSSFTHIDILKYRQFVKQDVVVVHRVNECDERKGTNFVNQYLIESNNAADATIFVSTFLKDLFIKQGLECENIYVVLSGANSEIFYPSKSKKNSDNKRLKAVTHHWGANLNKGFDIYKMLDEALSNNRYYSKFEFTYIGNIPKNINFLNSVKIEPLAGKELADKIRDNDFYITGSLNEPSGNHHIEAAQCGLPILYINSGGIPEYCNGFGLMFEKDNFFQKLEEMYDNFEIHKNNIKGYSLNSLKMSEEYLKIFEDLLLKKNNLMNNRKTQNLINIFEKMIYLFLRKIKRNIKNL